MPLKAKEEVKKCNAELDPGQHAHRDETTDVPPWIGYHWTWWYLEKLKEGNEEGVKGEPQPGSKALFIEAHPAHWRLVDSIVRPWNFQLKLRRNLVLLVEQNHVSLHQLRPESQWCKVRVPRSHSPHKKNKEILKQRKMKGNGWPRKGKMVTLTGCLVRGLYRPRVRIISRWFISSELIIESVNWRSTSGCSMLGSP